MVTALFEPGDEDVLYVVDLMGYVFRAYHALPPMSTSRGEPTHAVYGVTQMLLALVKTQHPKLLAVALDPKGPSFRKDLFSGYKATRKEHPADLSEQLERVEEVIDAYAIPAFRAAPYEADDIIATLVKKARAEGLRTVVVSADKDLLQLVSDDTLMFDTMRDRVYGIEETVQKLGVPPHKVRDYLALTGDSSDNIPGVPSVGPKTASTLLTEYDDLDAIYAGLDGMKKKALRDKLAAHKEDAYLSRRLVSLVDDVPVSLDRSALRYAGADPTRLRSLFSRLEFHKLLPQIEVAEEAPSAVEVVRTEPALRAMVDRLRARERIAMHTLADGDDALAAPIVGIAFASEDHAYYVALGHLAFDAGPQLEVAVLARWLGPLLDVDGPGLAVGDAKREMLLLRRLGLVPRRIDFDAMLASYLVDPERHGHSLEELSRSEHAAAPLESLEVLTDKRRGHQLALADVDVDAAARFAIERATLCFRVDRTLSPRIEGQGLGSLFGEVELPLARLLARMEGLGIAIDAPRLLKLAERYEVRIAALEKKAYELAGHEFKIGSPRALETVLFDELGLRVVKRTKTARSTDHAVLEELAHEHELPRVIVDHRMLQKLVSTYLLALPRQVRAETGRVHTRFNQAIAATGRMSSSDPNLQNIPIRTDEGRAIRDAFIPRQGFLLMSADYSQIELRVLAHLSDDQELVDAFSKDEDVHVRTASALFEVPRSEVDREMRGRAKTVNYAVIYGQTKFALARNLGIDKEEAQRYIDAFFKRYSGVSAFMDDTVEKARLSGGVRTLLGRWRTLPDIRSRNRGLRAAAERVARNTPIQGTAADLMKVAMVRIDRTMRERKLESEMLLTVHDELVFEVRPDEESEMRRLVHEGMEQVMALKVPLVVDLGVGATWNEAH